MAKGYYTRLRARARKTTLQKLIKTFVNAADELLREDMDEVPEEEVEKAREYLAKEMKKEAEDSTKMRILLAVNGLVDGEEPGETDDEEEQEVDDGVEEEDFDDLVEDNLEDEEGEAILVLSKKVQKDETTRKEKEAEEEKKKDEKENMKEDDTKGKEIHTPLKTTFTGVGRSHSVNRIADTSVTEKTIESKDRDPMTFRLQRASALLSDEDNMTTRSQSLASLLTAAHPTPLRSIRSASSHSMFAEETLNRRSRRSSQDLAHLILLSEKSQIVTPGRTADDSSIVCLGSVRKEDDSIVCLGSVKNTPVIKEEIDNSELTSTPHLPHDVVSRIRLCHVSHLPIKKETNDTIRKGSTTDRHVTDTEISPIPSDIWNEFRGPRTNRHVTDMEISPVVQDRNFFEMMMMEKEVPQAANTPKDLPRMDMEISPTRTDRNVVSMELCTPSPSPKKSSSSPRFRNRLDTPFWRIQK